MNQEETAGPIFVGGLDRTGTSLIYALLASHPRIAMTRRTNWWPYFYDRYGDLAEDVNLDRLLETMARYRRHRKLRPDFAALRTAFVAGPRTYGRLFELLESQHAARLGKPRWGDKSLHTERYAPTVFDSFPNARIIHMIRDPRDRYASVLKRWKSVRGGIGGATAAWLASVRLAERNQRRYPGRYLLLRYEDLAADPVSSLRRVSEFIGEPYDAGMLEMDGATEFRSSGGNSSYGAFEVGTISTRSIGRFRDTLTPAEIAFVQSRARTTMLGQGYDPVDVPMSRAARFRYVLAEWPLNAAKLIAWRARERLYDLQGRSPGANTLESEGEDEGERDEDDEEARRTGERQES